MKVQTRRILIRRPGSYSRLEQIKEETELTLGSKDVWVETRAAGVNYADCVIRMGLYQSAKEFVGWPITPGFEFSGQVVSLGPDVKRFKPGDAVFGVTRFGAYSSHVRVSENYLYSIPKQLDFLSAATFPTVFLTAYYPLFQLTRIRSAQKVLVHSAAGGVGGALVQLCKAHGCFVVGVVGRSEKVEVARRLGADAVIDKSSESLWPRAKTLAPEGYDVVLDANGAETLRKSFQSLRPSGKLVVYGFHSMLSRTGRRNYPKLIKDYLKTPRFDPIQMTNENKSVLAFNLSYLFEELSFYREAMDQLLEWLEDGRIRPLSVKAYRIEEVAEAQRALESGATTGKLALSFH